MLTKQATRILGCIGIASSVIDKEIYSFNDILNYYKDVYLFAKNRCYYYWFRYNNKILVVYGSNLIRAIEDFKEILPNKTQLSFEDYLIGKFPNSSSSFISGKGLKSDINSGYFRDWESYHIPLLSKEEIANIYQ